MKINAYIQYQSLLSCLRNKEKDRLLEHKDIN
jgi:hypothetical protein